MGIKIIFCMVNVGKVVKGRERLNSDKSQDPRKTSETGLITPVIHIFEDFPERR